MVISEFFAKLGLDVDTAGFARASSLLGSTSTLLKGFAGIAAAAGGALIAMVASTAAAGHEAEHTAMQIGVSTTALQEMQYAAKVSGVGADELTTGMRLLSRQMYAASQGQKEAAEGFNALGVSTTGANGGLLSTQDVLEQVADKFQTMDDGAEKTALAMKLFGRSGAALIPMLNKGADGIAALSKEAEDLGVVLDEGTIKQAEELHASWARAEGAITGLKNAIAGPLMSAVTPMLTAFAKWVAANRMIIAQKIHQVVNVIAKALQVVWVIGSTVVDVVEKIANGIGDLAAKVGISGNALIAVAVAVGAAWLIASSPLALFLAMLALVVLVADEIYHTLIGDHTLLRDIWDAWSGIVDKWIHNTEGDGWFTAAIKSVLATLEDIAKWIYQHRDEIAAVFKAAIDGFVLGVKVAVAIVEEILDKVKLIVSATKGLASLIPGGKTFNIGDVARDALNDVNAASGPAGADGAPSSPPVMFPGLVPPQATAAPFPSVYGNPGVDTTPTTVTNHFTIVQQPGEDGEALAHRVGPIVVEHLNRAHRQAKEGG